MKDVDVNYEETDHIEHLPEEGHQTAHHVRASYVSPTDDEYHSPYARSLCSIIAQNTITRSEW